MATTKSIFLICVVAGDSGPSFLQRYRYCRLPGWLSQLIFGTLGQWDIRENHLWNTISNTLSDVLYPIQNPARYPIRYAIRYPIRYPIQYDGWMASWLSMDGCLTAGRAADGPEGGCNTFWIWERTHQKQKQKRPCEERTTTDPEFGEKDMSNNHI